MQHFFSKRGLISEGQRTNLLSINQNLCELFACVFRPLCTDMPWIINNTGKGEKS